MDNLIIRVLNGDASPFEVQRLSRWRDESPENEALFRELSKVWELTAPEPGEKTSAHPPVAEVLKAAEALGVDEGSASEDSQEASPPSSPGGTRVLKPRRPWRSWGLMAASVTALAIGLRAMGPLGPNPLAEYRAPSGETLTVTLNDGSFVRMAEGSLLRVWDESSQREVSLEGKAFFAVTRDESRPFTVRTDHGDIRVLGTRFEVGESEDGVRAVVVEGLVSLSNEAGAVEVPAGSMARMSEGVAPVAEEAPDLWSLLDWPDGILVFQETPLVEVAAEVSRHFQQPLRVADPELGSRRITAWFQWESFTDVSDAICAVVGAPCQETELGVTMGTQAEVGGTP